MSENKESIKRTLKRLDAMEDEAIDYSDVPPLSPEMFAQALVQKGLKPVPGKAQITLRLARMCWNGSGTKAQAIRRGSMRF